MKRLLCLVLLLSLWGCTPGGDEGVTFVYPKKGYVYSVAQGSVAGEHRDVTGQSLRYLVQLYLMGPQDENLQALYPSAVRLENLESRDGTLTLTLTRVGSQMTDISFTFAGACLAQTCFGLCDAEQVVIVSGDRQLTLNRDALVFQDIPATAAPTSEATEK